ncbi:hypothetical protein Cgig2_008327 [Carnegiea gigantea]|uniref:Uncharacterized protein n=1 Tax=Carnegiea gigantea TaxID=171969 RepID=A0A9Q1JMA7_9CARY|nr:hypothetical protein Cgig2_008327 [Carnegiea gigantea]
MHSKNTAQESSKTGITDSHQQPSEETDDMVEDTTYKMSPPGHVDESDSDDESQPEKKQNVKKSLKPPVKSAQLSVTKHKNEHKSLKKKQHIQKSAAVPIEGSKSVQSVPKPAEGDTKHKKIFQSRMSPSGFVGMIAHFNEAQIKAIQDMGFGGFLHL